MKPGGSLVLRITQTNTDDRITLRLEGDVNGQWVDELSRACARALENGSVDASRLVLDLAGVSSLDPAGLALCHALSGRGVGMTNCSPYVEQLLELTRDDVDR